LVEDDFEDFDEDECDFCAGRSNGSNKAMISATSEMRLIMRPPNTMEFVLGIIKEVYIE
jgi:hypothetical protein